MGRPKKNKQVTAPEEIKNEAMPTEAEDTQVEIAPTEEPTPEVVEEKIEEKVKEPKLVESPKTEEPPVQRVIYQNAGDQMMTIVHLYSQRTPVSYGNGKKKVFNRFGEKFSISVREFEQEFASSPVGEALLKQKILAVGEDCPKEIRERLDIDYSANELITPDRYRTLLSLDTQDAIELFETLCFEHKQLMAKIFADDFESNDGRNCQREKIKALNDVSKKYVNAGETGMFALLLEAISEKEKAEY